MQFHCLPGSLTESLAKYYSVRGRGGDIAAPGRGKVVSVRTVVGAVIVDSLDSPARVMAARRSRPQSLRGRWEFPGGKVEDAESPDAALIREVSEELNITIVLGAELTRHGDSWPISDQLELRLFLAEILTGEPSPGESHDDVRWLSADDLESVDWLDADRAALPAVRDALSS